MMISRAITTEIQTLAKEFPAVAILGPRQSGKTTLAKHLFKNYAYVSFEDPDIRRLATEDPRAFLARYPEKAIFDEIQRVPEMLSYLQSAIDERRQPGRFILTGSQNYLLMENVSQSLAGRVGVATLLPFSADELIRSRKFSPSLAGFITTGGYPRIYDHNIRPRSFYQSYLSTYLEKDVRTLKNIVHYDKFLTFLKILAGRTARILNTLAIADECGITHNTVNEWLSVLETSYVIFRLPPYHKNFNKRLVKRPKIYFYDTGLVCYLLGVHTAEQFETHYYKGAVFETFAVSELMKHIHHHALSCRLYFWRDNHRKEIDVIAEDGPRARAAEIKSAQTFQKRHIEPLLYWIKLTQTPAPDTCLINGGHENFTFQNISVLGWQSIPVLLKDM